ncbi:MAG: extracellular solute-binding protein [Rhizobiales bacterium]|nr:extracellular solute-binding protein [Hyphomicrobiales bacterium]
MTSISRRTLLTSASAAAVSSLAAPALVSDALSSSGELNILMWSDYLPQSFVKAFTDKTGIKLNHTAIGSNEAIVEKMRASGGAGFDIASPTNHRNLQWAELGLLQPIDMARVPIDNVTPSMAKIGSTGWNFGDKGPHWLPFLWGTEGIAWRTDNWTPQEGVPSYGDIWAEETAGKTMGRPQSMLLGAGLYLETTGVLQPGEVWSAYESEDKMRPVWEKITEWCIARKPAIKLFWNDADSQKKALLDGDVVVGQTWDGPPLALKNAGNPVMYRAPKEGALAWVDGLAISAGAKNIDQIYAFIDFAYTPEPAGRAVQIHGYNSPVVGADKFAGASYIKNFGEAYPGDALGNLNTWPAEPPWYAALRAEFVARFTAA